MKVRSSIIAILALCLGLLFSRPAPSQTLFSQDWPVEIQSNQGRIEIYEPQPETLKANKLTGRAAVSITPTGTTSPVFGAIWFNAVLKTDFDGRSYVLTSINVTRVKFPKSTPEQESDFEKVVESELPKRNLHGSMESLTATLATAQKEMKESESLQNAPPKIIYVKYPAVLALINGEPILEPVEGTNLKRVANTPMLMVFDPDSSKYYLSSGSAWYSTSDLMGNWQINHNVPADVAGIVTDNGQPVASTIPDAQMPRIIVSKVPAELIVSQGEPQYSSLPGSSLLYMTNTENDVFMDITAQQYYVLLSGRWYISSSLNGPWAFVPPANLPADLAKIPPNSSKGDVLASVPGTDQAQDALIASQIPQTAEVSRSDAHLTVEYDGDPQFNRISGTDMSYAINTSTPVLLVNGRYYACDNGVWFVALTPDGPWVAADSIPDDIQTLPPDCPVYNVKYVYIYDSTPDEIYVGYTPGYYGWYPYYGTIVFGTGYWYHGWHHNFYYPWPCTWGFAAHYYPFVGWGFGFTWGVGFLAVGENWHDAWRDHDHDRHGHGWYGPGGYHAYYPAPRGNAFIQNNINRYQHEHVGNQIHAGYQDFQVTRGQPHNIYRRPENTGRVSFTPQQHNMGGQNRNQGRPNNVILNREGNVYRNNQNGWQKNNGPTWSQAIPLKPGMQSGGQQNRNQPQNQGQTQGQRYQDNRPSVPQHVQQEYQNRQRGEQRSYATPNRPYTGGGEIQRGGGGPSIQRGGGGGGGGGGHGGKDRK